MLARCPTLLRFFPCIRAFFTQKTVSQADCQQPPEKNYRALCFDRLEHLFAADFETIRSIDFDEVALIKQFAPQFLAHLPAIADDLAAWTDTTSFLQRFGDGFSAQQQAAIAAHTFRPE